MKSTIFLLLTSIFYFQKGNSQFFVNIRPLYETKHIYEPLLLKVEIQNSNSGNENILCSPRFCLNIEAKSNVDTIWRDITPNRISHESRDYIHITGNFHEYHVVEFKNLRKKRGNNLLKTIQVRGKCYYSNGKYKYTNTVKIKIDNVEENENLVKLIELYNRRCDANVPYEYIKVDTLVQILPLEQKEKLIEKSIEYYSMIISKSNYTVEKNLAKHYKKINEITLAGLYSEEINNVPDRPIKKNKILFCRRVYINYYKKFDRRYDKDLFEINRKLTNIINH